MLLILGSSFLVTLAPPPLQLPVLPPFSSSERQL